MPPQRSRQQRRRSRIWPKRRLRHQSGARLWRARLFPKSSKSISLSIEQSDEDDDRYWNAQKPEQNTTSHSSLHCRMAHDDQRVRGNDWKGILQLRAARPGRGSTKPAGFKGAIRDGVLSRQLPLATPVHVIDSRSKPHRPGRAKSCRGRSALSICLPRANPSADRFSRSQILPSRSKTSRTITTRPRPPPP